jgi:membrane-associated protease RseP (regulator of RpoE activity)
MKSIALLGLVLALGTSVAAAKPPVQRAPAPPKTQAQTQSKSFSFSFGTGKGRLGTSVVTMTEELRQHFGAPVDAGLLVSKVEADSPAAKAGVKVGDVLTRVDGEPVTDSSDVANALSDKKKGEAATVVVVRNKRTLTLSAKLDSDADDAFDFDISIDGNQILKKAPSGQGWQWNFTWPPGGKQQQGPTQDMKRFQDRLKKLEKKYKTKPKST